MTLFHFTSSLNWEAIRKRGRLTTTDPRLNPRSAALVRFMRTTPLTEGNSEALIEALEMCDELWGTSPHPLDPKAQVVWLTAEPKPSDQRWAREMREPEKTSIRISVSVPDAKHWPVWARQQGCPERWYEQLGVSGGRPEDWYVIERPVTKREWRSVEVPATGEVLWKKTRQKERL